MFDNDQTYSFDFKQFFIPLTTKKAILIIIAVGIAVFVNMLFNGFVWDDITYIINNPVIHSFDIFYILKENLFNSAGQYRPIPALYFSLLYILFGNVSFFYHFLQLSLHITCTILLFIFFKEFFSKKISLFLSLIFLIHPIQIEGISFIAQTVNPIFFLFGILALLKARKKSFSKKDYLMLFILLLGSLLTKETGVLFLFIVYVYRYLFIDKKVLPYILHGISILSVYAFIRFFIAQIYLSTRKLAPIAHITFIQRISTMPAIIWYYLKTFFFPLNLAVDQQWIVQHINLSSFYFPLFLDLLYFSIIILFGLYLYLSTKKSFKIYIFFSLWFFCGLLFHIQIFPLDMTVADRWFYFPIVGLIGILGIAFQTILHKKRTYQNILVAGGVTVIILLSLRTMARNADWQDNMALFSHDVQFEDSFDINNNLGMEYVKINKFDKAIYYFTKSVNQLPFEYNLNNLGVAYQYSGNIPMAKKYYELSLQKNYFNFNQKHKHDERTYISSASVLTYYDDSNKARVFIQNALQDYPNSWYLWFYLALADYKLGDKSGALTAATKAYEISSNSQTTYIYSKISANQPIQITSNGKTIFFSK